VGGHITSLRRIQSGRYKITEALHLDNLNLDKIKLISMAEVAMELFPSVKVELDEIQDLIHGRFVRKSHEPAQTIALIDKKPSLVALAQGDGVMLKPHVVFASGIGGV
jgi:tRNA U55 pseudouridine synthase TruB